MPRRMRGSVQPTNSTGVTPVTPASSPIPASSPSRIIIDEVAPSVDRGRFPIKRTVGERVTVAAVILVDGHDTLAGVVKYRPVSQAGQLLESWREVPLQPAGPDRWSASFPVTDVGTVEYTVEAWIDRFTTWLKGLVARAGAGQDV